MTRRKSSKKRIEPAFEKRGGKPPAQRRRTRPKKAKRRGTFGIFGAITYWSLVVALWGGIAATGMVAWYGAKMPSATTWAIPDRPPNVKIVSIDGKLIANRGMTGGEAIGLHEMSPYLPLAVIAIEDRRFHKHFGIDPVGLARAMVHNAVQLRWVQGGSTLTQQLAKNLFLKPDRTIERKLQEVLLALWLEHEYTKDQILEMYLNRVYFGSGSYGAQAAARRYFGKPARDLALSEAALMAGLLKAPSRLSPARDHKAAEERAQIVLAAMREENMIGDREMTAAISTPARKAASYWTGSENYVADRVMADLAGIVGAVREDIIVDTSVDLDLQHVAEKSIRRLIKENREKGRVSQGALVSIDGSGAVRAMVGGHDYADSQFDRASEALRQPGSAFKPFVFQAALESGLSPATIRQDAPVRIGKWKPENYKGKYYGPVTLTTALAKSLNSVSARLVNEIGARAVIETAHRMGIDSKLNRNASIALGTSEVTLIELTTAYTPYANGGYRPPVHFIRRVTTASGKVLYNRPHGGAPQVVRSEIAGMMNMMMAETITHGTARRADFGWPAAGKTGTSQKSRDAWFVGYTANLTTGVWFGNDDGTPMRHVTGGTLPAMAWREFMVAAHNGVAKAPLPGTVIRQPANVAQKPDMPGDNPDRGEITGSTRLVPPADVGVNPQKRDKTTILDIIFGR